MHIAAKDSDLARSTLQDQKPKKQQSVSRIVKLELAMPSQYQHFIKGQGSL